MKHAIARNEKYSKFIWPLYLQQEAPNGTKEYDIVRFESEHDVEYYRLGSSKKIIEHRPDMLVIMNKWSERFHALTCKTVRIMDDETAQKLKEAYDEMVRIKKEAFDKYQAELEQAWSAARPLRQRDIDPEMIGETK